MKRQRTVPCLSSGQYAVTSLPEEAKAIIALLAFIDGATPFVEITLGVLATVAIGATLAQTITTKEDEKAESIADAKVASPQPPPVYVGVDFYGGRMNVITEPMQFDEAVNWTISTAASGRYSDRAAWGLLTEKSTDAMAMAIYLGAPGPVSFDEARRNHLPHYHTANRIIIDGANIHCGQSFHIWYGGA